MKFRSLPMITVTVFILSLSTFCYEVLLARSFSISQWNHLAFMVISLVLFGFAFGGTLLNILATRIGHWESRFSTVSFIYILIILYTLSGVGSFILINQIPLDYFRLPIEPIQFFYLFLTYVSLSIPFMITGFIISLAYAIGGEKSGVIYLGSMVGSACGALIPPFILPYLEEGRLILLAAVLPLLVLPVIAAGNAHPGKRKYAAMVIPMVFITIFSVVLVQKKDPFIRVKPSDYKSVSQVLLFPDTHVKSSNHGIRGRIDHVISPYIRFAPGLSLKFTDTLPRQEALFRDGDNMIVLNHPTKENNFLFAFNNLNLLGYIMVQSPDQVLIIQRNGGIGIPCAIASGANHIRIIEQDPQISRFIQDQYNLPVINQNPRAYLAKSNQKYDIIHIENWGNSVIGSAALNQEFDYTVNAFIIYLSHLKKNGIIIVSRKLLLPPADSVRLLATAFESLKKIHVKSPEHHILVLRNWDTFTMLVSLNKFRNQEIIFKQAERLNFDIVYSSEFSKYIPNRFHQYDAPYYHFELNQLADAYKANSERDYFRNYILDVLPQTDDRPFPSRFLKWPRLHELYQSTGSRFYTLYMSGEIVISVILIQAMVVSSILLLLPFYLNRKFDSTPALPMGVYFFSVGSGFMFVEFFFFKKFVLIFGDPIISFTLVCTGIMLFSGAGGFISMYINLKRINISIITLIVSLCVLFFIHDNLITGILKYRDTSQYFFALLLLAPSGLLMGLPLPFGMKLLSRAPSQSSYAWAVNGCASVLASVISAQIAISLGISTILVFGIFAYLVTFFSFQKVSTV